MDATQDDEVGRHLPLKPRDYHVLFALRRQRLHGYGLMKAVADDSGGLLRLDPTSLYRRLRVLLDGGLVAEAAIDDPGPDHDDRRKYYELTSLGRLVLRAEARRLRALVGEAEAAALFTGEKA